MDSPLLCSLAWSQGFKPRFGIESSWSETKGPWIESLAWPHGKNNAKYKKKTAKGLGDKIQRLEITQRVIRKNMLEIESLGPRSACQKCLQDKNQGPKIQANAWWQRLMFSIAGWCQLVPSDACPLFRLSQIAPVVRPLLSHFWFFRWIQSKTYQKAHSGQLPWVKPWLSQQTELAWCFRLRTPNLELMECKSRWQRKHLK